MTTALIQQVFGYLGSLVGTNATLTIPVFPSPTLQHAVVMAPGMVVVS